MLAISRVYVYYAFIMGVVYSPVEVINGEIPNHGDHRELGKSLLEFVRNEPSLRAGILYGSTVYDKASLRSDVDVLYVYEDDGLLSALTSYRSLVRNLGFAGNYARPEAHFEPTKPLLKDGQSDKQYIAHFKRVQAKFPEWTINNPLQYLDLTDSSKNELTRNTIGFVARKQAKFAKALVTERDPEDYQTYQRALECPIAIARKIVQLIEPNIEVICPAEDKKAVNSTIQTIFARLVDDGSYAANEADVLHHSLIDIDNQYTQVLTEVLDTGNVLKYITFLRNNRDEAISQALKLSVAWQKILETSDIASIVI